MPKKRKEGNEERPTMLVRWNDWGTSAFARARREKKPILLAISATWCHWCHTMDQNTYRNPAMAKFINAHFVPVRVDTDRRPDINARYNLGGWPTTAILTPDGALLTGVLYAPPEHLLPFLQHVLKVFTEKRATLPTVTAASETCRPATVSPLLDDVVAALRRSFDPKHGGFGTEPKFPQHPLLRFLLALARHPKHGEEAREMLDTTLTRMAAGQIHDREEGGFYRYATRQDWSQPHWEKMLDDNAQLIEIYAEAARVLRKPEFAKVAEQSTAFVLKRFFDTKTGLFYASQDADEEYCLLALAERKKRRPPAIDKTLYADKNAMMINALITMGKTAIAEKALTSLLKRLRTKKGIAHSYDTGAHEPFLLQDAVEVLRALLATKKEKEAQQLFRQMQALFMDARAGVFYDIPARKDALGLLKIRRIDFEANAELALLLLGWRPAHRTVAERILRCIAGQAHALGIHAATYALAAEQLRKV